MKSQLSLDLQARLLSCKAGKSIRQAAAQGGHPAHGTPRPARQRSVSASETCPCCLSCFTSRDRELTTLSLKHSRHWSCLQSIHDLVGEAHQRQALWDPCTLRGGPHRADSPGPVRGCSQQTGQSSRDGPWKRDLHLRPCPEAWLAGLLQGGGTLCVRAIAQSLQMLGPQPSCWSQEARAPSGTVPQLPYPTFTCAPSGGRGLWGPLSPVATSKGVFPGQQSGAHSCPVPTCLGEDPEHLPPSWGRGHLEGEAAEGRGARGPGQCRGLLNPQPRASLFLWEQQAIPVRQVRGARGQSPWLPESTKHDLPPRFPDLLAGLSQSCWQTCSPRE